LIVESGELKGLRNRDAESTKAFISSQVDRWIPKYMEHEVSSPRRFVLLGSTNRHDFLIDETGNRRWLPFDVGQCDPAAMARDRDQLWAEARDMFQRDGVHYAEAERLAREHHARYLETDPWEPGISDYVAGREWVTTEEILGRALCKTPRERSRADEMRVAKTLQRLGWERRRDTRQGERAYRFYPTCLTCASPELGEVGQ
jgi:predicted P-loop ATPase